MKDRIPVEYNLMIAFIEDRIKRMKIMKKSKED